MLIPLPEYVKIKNNYCLSTLKLSREKIFEIYKSISYLEKHFPGLKLFMLVNENCEIKDDRVIKISQFKKTNFAYLRELEEDDDLFKENGL